MEQTMSNILGKASDYKICKKCNKINWYENEECIECEGKKFNDKEEDVIILIEADYEYYKNEGYDETEIDEVSIDV